MEISKIGDAEADSLQAARSHLEAAISMAKQGDALHARQKVQAEIDAFDQDIEVLHKAGVLMRLCEDDEAALKYFHKVLTLNPGFHFSEIEIGDIYAERGDKKEALGWYLKAKESAPSYRVSYIRAAKIEYELGHAERGLDLLEELHRQAPSDVQCNLMRANFLNFLDKGDQQIAVLSEMIASNCDDQDVHFSYLQALTETGQYHAVVSHAQSLTPEAGSRFEILVAAFSGHAQLALASHTDELVAAAVQREHTESWLTGAAAFQQLRAAIDENRPFSLIRLGDGEARFLTYFDPQARDLILPIEAHGILELHWDNWFGRPLPAASEGGVRDLYSLFREAINDADILGVTPSGRYVRDNIHRGYLGVQERILAERMERPHAPKFASAFVHAELHRVSPFYQGLLAGADFLGVVSPHPGLAERLARFHGIDLFREWLVPGESRLPEAVRGRSGSAHFPDRFNELMSTLQVPKRGAVFLVAAGLLGKIYCHRIKQLGGIALDVGACVDAWMGFKTRPGEFEPEKEWILPAKITNGT
ncbi:tetratricopeptide repeat protein [Rhodoblastus sp.]|jgi:tetratricopeptide (TPR) repeat protein|uniref:tetratricopeptide repeat protein n=1 Tax=Rhodoblastus sp. TaxID=1962975 RepID=UPI0025F3DF86|nr:tetratricopeptide repeat protein [Rhodoblastus sp.]